MTSYTASEYRGLAERIRFTNDAGNREILNATLYFNLKIILAALYEAAARRSTSATILTLHEVEDADS